MEDGKCKEGYCKFDTYQVGEKDTSGRLIEQIVYYEYETYMIYFVAGDYLKAYFVDAYEVRSFFKERFQQLVAQIKSMNVKNIKENEFVRQSFASAYYNAVNGYSEVAIGELVSLKNKLVYEGYNKWLTVYMACNIALIVICAIVILTTPNSWYDEMCYCMISSCVGSFLVYSRKENNYAGERNLPIIDAAITFSASCVSGFLVYCILKSNLLLGIFNENIYGMMIVCFAAGYNEDVPLKLLKSITGMVGSTKNKSS